MFPWLAALALARPTAPSPAPVPPPGPDHYRLENGLEVVLLPDPSTPLVAVDVWYHVGSRVEAPGRTGFAHLFEHLMFQGSPNQPENYMTPLEKVGARINGSTTQDRTNYYEVVPREDLPLALFLEADRMGGLLQVLTQKELDNQREVVRNERRQRIENVPYGDARLVLQENLYPAGHGYHHPTIGSHEDLEAATLDDVSAFFRRWYAPNDATLVLAGDFDPATAKELVAKWFGPIAKADQDPVPAPPQPVLDADLRIRSYRDVPQSKVWLVWHAPPAGDQVEAELDLLASLLGDGRDGRLVQELVEKRKVASDVAVAVNGGDWSSIFQIRATAAAGHTTDEVIAAIDDVLRALPAAPPSTDDLAAVERSAELAYQDGREPVLGQAELAQSCLVTWHLVDCRDQDLGRYRAATPDSVVAAEQRWLLASHRVVLDILPTATRPVLADTTPLKVKARVRKGKAATPPTTTPTPTPTPTEGEPR